MNYTKAIEKDSSTWSLSEFITLHGNFSIVKEVPAKQLCGRFNSKGICTDVHIEKKVRRTSVSYILNHQEEYEVVVVIDEYCLYKIGDIIDYSTIAADSAPSINQEESYYTAHDYYMDNPDIFLGEVL
jgi:hypothetical protein